MASSAHTSQFSGYSPGHELPTDAQFRRFVLLRKLNVGGTSVVYEAVDRMTAGFPSVAIKVIDLRHADARLRTRFEREVRIGTSVDHPNIVKILDTFLDGLNLCIVEEYVRGWDLLDVLNRQPHGALSEERAREVFLQMLEGVTYLHRSGVSHRDIKPENILVEAATGRVKIIDLGLSKHLSSARTLGIGTPGYIAPELILRGEPASDHPQGSYDSAKADVFSLGATLYLTLSGYHCFEDPSNPRDITNMLKNQIRGLCRPLPHHLSRSTVAFLLQRMLVPDPRKRATLEEVCNHPWTQEGLRKMQQNALLVAQWPMGSSPSTAASPNAAVRPQQVPVPVPVSPGAAFGSADAQSPYPLAQQYYDFQ